MKKNYVVDTSVLLDDEQCIEILRNGEENKVYITHTVLLELDGLKKDKRLSHFVNRIVKKIEEDDKIIFIRNTNDSMSECGDLQIINEIISSDIENPIIVTNDALFRVICRSKGIESQEFKSSSPYESESQMFTGFQKQGEDPVINAFTWIDGKPYFNSPDGSYRVIDYTNEVWNVKPLTIYQNLAFELMLNDNIDLITLQSQAGHGKSYLSLACALHKTLQEKKYEKIYLVKPTIEIGESLGFLPGNIEDKVDPYIRYLINLIYKLHNLRGSKNSKIFTTDSVPGKLKLNPELFEILPIQYTRGMNIDNSFVIIDECMTHDQKIIMEDSSIKTIGELYKDLNYKNYKVKTFNLNCNEIEANKIVNIKKKKTTEKLFKIKLSNGKILKLTENHKLYVKNRGYIKIKDLNLNDELIYIEISDLNYIKIENIDYIDNDEEVYLMEVEKNHNYFIDGVLSKNCQNLSRLELRVILSRMGKNVKCVCIGDQNQIDNKYLNKFNNGLNWIVKMCKGEKNYAHLVLKGDKSRGPICDLILKTKL